MRLPRQRGAISAHVIGRLSSGPPSALPPLDPTRSMVDDEDAQLALWVLHEMHYRGFDGVDVDLEWDPELIAVRRDLERRLEQELRARTTADVAVVDSLEDVAEQIFALAAHDGGPSLASHLHRHATRGQLLEFLRSRSIYHLKESDPQAFVLPRLEAAAKTALGELLYDEFGGGRPERLHATMYGDALEACGLDRAYGTYIDEASGLILAQNNVMSMFALNRGLTGAAMGHLAMFEVTSSVPSRKIAAGIERVGLPATAAAYYWEHVEADAVHEQLAARDICGSLVAADPSARADILFGAVTCLLMDALVAVEQLDAWRKAAAVA